MKKIFTVLAAVLLLMTAYETIISFQGGIGGHTRKNLGTVGDGCICHTADSTASVQVRISGPDLVLPNSTHIYRITMRGGPAVTGGFDFNVKYGNTDTLAGQETVIIPEDTSSLDISHRFPKPFSGDSVSWLVKYIAPDTNVVIYDTLYATGNSTNNDLFPNDSDKWNFSPNFVVQVNPSIGIQHISSVAEGFSLKQNYPNPFNPETNVRFEIPEQRFVTLKVYDITGREIATLVNEQLHRGTYEVKWNASRFSSGVYYYRITVRQTGSSTGDFAAVKKMVLVK